MDRFILAAANAYLYLRHPRIVRAFFRRLGYLPSIAAPRHIAELVHWRKLVDHNPLHVALTDKLFAKEWVAGRCPHLRIPETVWIGDRPDDIPERFLTADYVVKTTHGSSQNYFPGRSRWDRDRVNRTFNKWLVDNRSYRGEWAYSQIKPRIFVEKLLVPNKLLLDVQVRAANGSTPLVSIQVGAKTASQSSGYFRPDGSRHPEDPFFGQAGGLDPNFVAPPTFTTALEVASKLSEGLDYVRVDLLDVDGDLYFSEMTFYPASGFSVGSIVAEMLPYWMDALDQAWFTSVRHGFPTSIYADAFKRRYLSPSAGSKRAAEHGSATRGQDD